MPANDYTIGRGCVLFRKTGQTGLCELGNSPDFKLNIESEKLPHFSSKSGLKTKDREVVLQQIFNAAFTLDEPVAKNLALFFMANDPTENTVGSGSVVDEAATSVEGKWIRLGNHNLTKGTVVVTGTAGTPVFVEGTDFKINHAAGYLFTIPTADGGSIGDVTTLEVDYDHTGVVTQTIDAGTVTTITGELTFLGDPGAGRIIDIRGNVTLASEGELPLISDDWTQFNFTAEFIDDDSFPGVLEIVDRGLVV